MSGLLPLIPLECKLIALCWRPNEDDKTGIHGNHGCACVFVTFRGFFAGRRLNSLYVPAISSDLGLVMTMPWGTDYATVQYLKHQCSREVEGRLHYCGGRDGWSCVQPLFCAMRISFCSSNTITQVAPPVVARTAALTIQWALFAPQSHRNIQRII